MTPLTQTELNEIVAKGCTTPGCDHKHGFTALFFHGRCHGPEVEVSYEYGSGVLKVNCRVCQRPVLHVKVATGNTN